MPGPSLTADRAGEAGGRGRAAPRHDACAARFRRPTAANLYNTGPTRVALAHATLEDAVFAAYDWRPDLSDEQTLEKLLALNLERAQAEDGQAP